MNEENFILIVIGMLLGIPMGIIASFSILVFSAFMGEKTTGKIFYWVKKSTMWFGKRSK